MRITKRQLKAIIRESVQRLLVENMNYLIAQAEEYIEYDGADYDTMEEFCAEMSREGYDLSDCETAFEQARINLGE